MSEVIEYNFKRSARARGIRISVHGDGQVVVTAPRWVSQKIVAKFVASKTVWIKAKVDFSKLESNVIVKGGNRREYKKYCESARRLVGQKLKEINQHYGLTYGRVSIRFQKTRWGSCSKNGNLNFNYRLIFLPEALVDYLITHELCHLKEMNHSIGFWRLVGETISDYKDKSKQLRKMR